MNTQNTEIRENLYHDIQQTILADMYDPATGTLTLPDLDHDPVMPLIDAYTDKLIAEKQLEEAERCRDIWFNGPNYEIAARFNKHISALKAQLQKGKS